MPIGPMFGWGTTDVGIDLGVCWEGIMPGLMEVNPVRRGCGSGPGGRIGTLGLSCWRLLFIALIVSKILVLLVAAFDDCMPGGCADVTVVDGVIVGLISGGTAPAGTTGWTVVDSVVMGGSGSEGWSLDITGRQTKWGEDVIVSISLWCEWKRTSLRCSTYFSGLRFIRIAPNHDSWRGPEFLMPSMISQGEISLTSCILKPYTIKAFYQNFAYFCINLVWRLINFIHFSFNLANWIKIWLNVCLFNITCI